MKKNNKFSLFKTKNSDAEDAVKARDGYDYDGYRLRVEFPRGSGPGSFRGNRNSERGGGGGGGGGAGGGRDGGNRNRGPPTKRSQFRVLVSGLPPSGSWQDLKDHMREAGDVCFADVYKDGSGVVEFLRHEDMKYAIKKLDDSRFRSHEVSRLLFFRNFNLIELKGVQKTIFLLYLLYKSITLPAYQYKQETTILIPMQFFVLF